MPEKEHKSAENEPSPIQVKKVDTSFSFTCTECDFRGDVSADPDWNWIMTPRGYYWKETDKYPNRCRTCERNKKRFQRMKRSIQKLYDISFDKYRTYGYPKMLTVGLPSKWNDDRHHKDQVKELKKRFKKLRQELLHYQVEGGIFQVELTQKVRFDNDLYGEEKYHAHVHAVVVMPYIPPKALPAFSEIGLKFGLGRIHIRGKDKSYKRSKDYKSHLASYLSKYITKDNVNGRSSRWGCMMKKVTAVTSNPKEKESNSS